MQDNLPNFGYIGIGEGKFTNENNLPWLKSFKKGELSVHEGGILNEL